jgi:hypothetical protein
LINIAIFLGQKIMYGPVSQFSEPFFCKFFFVTINLKQTSWALAPSIIEIYLGDMFIYGPVSSLLSPFFLTNYSGPTSQQEKQINMMLKFGISTS